MDAGEIQLLQRLDLRTICTYMTLLLLHATLETH